MNYIIEHMSAPTLTRVVKGHAYFHMSRYDIAMGAGLDEQMVSTALRFLTKIGLALTIYDRRKRLLFIHVNMDAVDEYLVKEEPKEKSKEAEDKVLFDYVEKDFSEEAEAIVNKAITRNRDVFTTKIPKEGSMTKAYSNSCRFLDDLFHGRVLGSRKYAVLNELAAENTNGCRDAFEDCEGDWSAINKMVMKAVRNYNLAHDPNRAPLKKSILTKAFNEWIYNDYTNTSWLVTCLEEPYLVIEEDEKERADEIYDELPSKAKKGGNRIYKMNLYMKEVPFWNAIADMVEWGDALVRCDSNARYWVSNGGELVYKFYEYLHDNDLTVSLSTVCIAQAVNCSGPWTWFVTDAVNKHRLHPQLANCISDKEVRRLYEKGNA